MESPWNCPLAGKGHLDTGVAGFPAMVRDVGDGGGRGFGQCGLE